jgi:pimeloyl-ACP methyl ester carboxylesterase
MRGDDRGRAFLKTMRRTERTPAKEALYRSAVRNVPYPVQVVWAADDPALKLSVYGERARAATGLNAIHTIPGKHFPQEDQAPLIADYAATIAKATESTTTARAQRTLPCVR